MTMRRMMAILVFCIVAFLTYRMGAATFCEQRFELLAAGDNVIWIAQDKGGECRESRLLSIHLDPQGATIGEFRLNEYSNWGPLRVFASKAEGRRPIELELKYGVFEYPAKGIRVKAPAPNGMALEAFDKFVRQGGDGAAQWNRETGQADMPVVQGVPAEVDYYLPDGLYLSYTMSKVYYLPDDDRLLIFTRQGRKGPNMDSMHGFVIMKLTDSEKK